MVAPRTILYRLRKYQKYLRSFPQNQRAIYFEKLIAQVFAGILNLPLYARDNDDVNVRHRVTWLGSDTGPSAAPPGRMDAVARAYKFHILIEPTMKTGSRQWSQEFAPCIRHGETYLEEQEVAPTNVYVILVLPSLHIDTLLSIRRHSRSRIRVIPLEVANLLDLLNTSVLAFSMRHLELRRLFNKISECVGSSDSIQSFNECSSDLISRWQEEVLRLEKAVYIGVKSYETMKGIGRKYIGTSEILSKLQKHPFVAQYLKMIGERIRPSYIEESLIQQSFASRVGKTLEGEELFCPVPSVDFRNRQEKLVEAVERVCG
jgi:hypothetical protein